VHDAQLSAHADSLEIAWQALVDTTAALADAAATDLSLALANSAVYLDAFGHTLVAWIWLRQASVATLALRRHADDPFYLGKSAAAAYFFGWILPTTAPMHALLRRLDRVCLEMRDAWF
jgi:butyryl-CoA dehydrogenase